MRPVVDDSAHAGRMGARGETPIGSTLALGSARLNLSSAWLKSGDFGVTAGDAVRERVFRAGVEFEFGACSVSAERSGVTGAATVTDGAGGGEVEPVAGALIVRERYKQATVEVHTVVVWYM